MAALTLSFALVPAAAEAASLTFSGYAGVPPPPPTDFAGYIERAFCGLPPPGRRLSDRRCAKVRAWMASNAGKPRSAWTAPPIID